MDVCAENEGEYENKEDTSILLTLNERSRCYLLVLKLYIILHTSACTVFTLSLTACVLKFWCLIRYVSSFSPDDDITGGVTFSNEKASSSSNMVSREM